MKLFQDKVRAIFAEAGIPLLRGELASTPEEAAALAKDLGGAAKVGAWLQRDAKAKQEASSPPEAQRIAQHLLTSTIEGLAVEQVWVEERPEVKRAVYAYVSLDRWEEKPFVLAHGRDIQNIYSCEYLQQAGIPFRHFSITEGLYSFEARALAKALGLKGRAIGTVGDILGSLQRLWLRYDAEFACLNPLIETQDGRLLAANVSLSVDEDALFRHPELKAEEEIQILRTERERKAEGEGTPWVDLEGDIGMFVAGSGMGMSANDVLVLAGGKPANFSDVGGGPSPERVANAFEALFTNRAVKGVLAFYFGGISRCDDFAKGLTMAIEKQTPRIPIAIKMAGTREKEGQDIIAQAMREKPGLYTCIRFLGGIETSIDDLVQKIVSFTAGK